MGIEIVLDVMDEALILLNKIVPDHATRIENKIRDLRQRWREEYAKLEKRDDNLLDLLDSELRDIRELFSSAIKAAALKSS